MLYILYIYKARYARKKKGYIYPTIKILYLGWVQMRWRGGFKAVIRAKIPIPTLATYPNGLNLSNTPIFFDCSHFYRKTI